MRCETDFVAQSEPFKTLAHELVLHIAAMNPATTDELLNQPSIKDQTSMVDQLIKSAIARLGENIRVERFARYEL